MSFQELVTQPLQQQTLPQDPVNPIPVLSSRQVVQETTDCDSTDMGDDSKAKNPFVSVIPSMFVIVDSQDCNRAQYKLANSFRL